MKFTRFLLLLAASASLMIAGCQLKEFVSPEYDISANIPFITRYYSVLEMLKGEQNLYVDSLSNDVILTGEVTSKSDLSNNIKFAGTTVSNNVVIYNRDTVISLKFDDSSAVRKAIFTTGIITLRFNNANNFPYNVLLRIQNLKNVGTNLPFEVSSVVPANTTINQTLNLPNYYIDNGSELSNKLDFFVRTSSSAPIGFGSFDYIVSETTLKFVSGKVKPTKSTALLDSTAGPLGKNAPNTPITLSSVKKATIKIHNFIATQIEFRRAYFYGYNKTTNTTKRLLYDYDGNGTKDSFYTVSIPARPSSGFGEKVLTITAANSNILEFIGNVPDKIVYVRDQYINPNNLDVSLDNKDSIQTFFEVEIPLRFSSTLYNSYKDTTKSGFTSKQLEDVDKSLGLKISTTITNAMGLKLKTRIMVQDSSGNNLIYLTGQYANQNPDSFYVIEAADVGPDGNVLATGHKTKTIDVTLTREDIIKIRKYGRVFVELQYITNPSAGTVRLKGDDFAYVRSQGTLQYRMTQ